MAMIPTISLIIIELIFDLFIKSKVRSLTKDIHGQVLTSVFKAPINKFFDVTPIGLIISRIRSDINVFQGSFFNSPRWLIDFTTHILSTLAMVIYLECYLTFSFMMFLYFMMFNEMIP